MTRPQQHEYAQSPYFSRYIDLVPDNAMDALERQLMETHDLFNGLSETQTEYRYAESKWTLKELLGHLIDAERIFAYRVLCIARGEQAALPGFDENTYVEKAHFTERPLASLLREYRSLRESNLALFASLTDEMLSRMGNANGRNVTARSIVYIVAGHERHHLGIIRERYLPGLSGPGLKY